MLKNNVVFVNEMSCIPVSDMNVGNCEVLYIY